MHVGQRLQVLILKMQERLHGALQLISDLSHGLSDLGNYERQPLARWL